MILTLSKHTVLVYRKNRLVELYNSMINLEFGRKQKRSAMQNILVIDDSEFDRRMIVSAMKSVCGDVRCVELSEGETALEIMRNEEPNLTIVDIRMPGIDGWELLDMIKSDQTLCELNVVMMSGSHSPEDIKMAAQKGADGFYTKPHKQAEYGRVASEIRDTFFDAAA